MKKITYILLLLVAFCSCQKSGDEKEILVRFNACEDRTISAYGDYKSPSLKVNPPAGYKIRYIAEVYYSNTLYSRTVQLENPDFELRLVAGVNYDILFWADYVQDSGADADNHYKTNSLRAVTVASGAYMGSDESRDAYCAALINVSYESAFTQSIELKRPFVRLEIVNKTVPATGDFVLVTYNSKLADTYDVKTKVATVTNTLAPLYPPTDANALIAYDYIFVGSDVSVCDLKVKVGSYKEKQAPSIPLEQNRRVIISGNFTEIP